MARPGSLKVAHGGGRDGNGLSGAAGKRPVPAEEAVGNEGLVSEGPAVSAGSVAACFPEAVDELGQRGEPFVGQGDTKGSEEILS